MSHTLPIDDVLPQIRTALHSHRNLVLVAEPGAGKTTRVPPSLMEEQWLGTDRIIMLEPRRLAAVRSAEYMAGQRGESAGKSIGYRIRGEQRTSAATRLEVVTEGILTRMLQSDAALTGIGLVIFDEFHERSIHADLGLALCLDIQQHLRPELRILVMSATLDHQAVAAMMGDAPVISSSGRTYPVTVSYLTTPPSDKIERSTAAAVMKAVKEQEGDILVFLPGQREIRRTEEELLGSGLPASVDVHLLYGESTPDQQRRSLSPAPNGRRKVILSTNIAETSLTIDGVRTVIDSGSMRIPVFEPRRGMSGLATVPVSKASAEQRKGRAGRQAPGHCYRLWTETQQALLPEHSKPEILAADLAPFAMELALWGVRDASSLKFLDPPPEAHLAQARSLLKFLGAMDAASSLTDHGKAMAALPVHPRIAHMLLKGRELGAAETACAIAALLEERDLLRSSAYYDIDLSSRLEAFRQKRTSDRAAAQRASEQAERLHSMIMTSGTERKRSEVSVGALLALAYPDRVAKRRSGERYQLSGNSIAQLPARSILSREEFLAVGETDGAGTDVKIFLAEPVTEEELRKLFAEQLVTRDVVEWNEATAAVTARTALTFGSLQLSVRQSEPTDEQSLPFLCAQVRNDGLRILSWTKDVESLVQRSEWLRKHRPQEEWPDLSEAALLDSLEHWLGPHLHGMKRRKDLERLELGTVILSLFSYAQLQTLDRLAPTHVVVPTGSRIALDYANDPPILAVRLQEMFGETKTPAVCNGSVPVLLHLLSPARRPLAVTQDLPSFWKNAYPLVRKDMRGEYPKHYWPEDPLEAEPTTRTKRHIERSGNR